jgi:HAD superfamily hydrolase (TIGR01509 family)
MDGTLVDTEPYWLEAETAMVHAHGGVWSHEDGLQLVGSGLERSALILQSRGVQLGVEEIIATLTDQVRERIQVAVPWRPGARELLTECVAAGVRCGLVTMSYSRFVAPIIAHLPPETFRVVVTGEQVEHGKPHPEPYLTASAALGLAPGECVAIEDSNTGAKSAEAAGCVVLVVPNHVPVLDGPRRVFRETLEGMGVEELRGLAIPSAG